jgi:hypothetical protein
MEAADTYIAIDNSAQGFANNAVQLAIGAPVSISEYLNNLPDSANWLERLTNLPSLLKMFRVPLSLKNTITTYNNIATSGLGVAPIYSTVSLTAKTAAISATTLCGTSSCGTGQYEIDAYLASTVSCTTPGSAAVGIQLTYTDDAGSKSAVTLPLSVNGGASLATTMGLGNTTNAAVGHTTLWSTGTVAIQYATSYVSCTTGTGTYSIRIAVRQLQ